MVNLSHERRMGSVHTRILAITVLAGFSAALGGQSAAILPGEDPKIFAGTIRHAF